MLTFNKNYFSSAVLIFCIEVFIALYVDDNFVRPYFGDVLVVILIYCFLKSFLRLPVLLAVIFVLAFAFTIEFFQFFDIVEKLGLEKSRIARTVIGTSFAWHDILAYIAGAVVVIVVEKYGLRKQIGTWQSWRSRTFCEKSNN
jgi:hypothetical protein